MIYIHSSAYLAVIHLRLRVLRVTQGVLLSGERTIQLGRAEEWHSSNDILDEDLAKVKFHFLSVNLE